ncbi:VanZ family protein [Halosegnis marinus]|uniref:VanZ family protein n=1 Tax=Halosegnis marinus TaxID=3034023 RepID=A0ABD5ZQI6_9EURY|nr:VanZ family protein [Halosegnis sp. DT85]
MDRPRVPLAPPRARYALVACAALAVLVASVVTPPGDGATGTLLGVPTDKWLHAAGYALLGAAAAYAAFDREGLDARRALAVVALVAAYGLAIEGIQAPLAARTADLADAAANAVGAVVGTLPWLGVRPR